MTGESQLEGEIKVLDETESDMEAKVEKLEKQVKQQENLSSDIEQLTKVHIHIACSSCLRMCMCVCAIPFPSV